MNNADPKERIQEAAHEIFGEKGYKSATIREICKKANVSLALVNYHFGSKEALYEEIVLGNIDRAFKLNPVEAFIRDGMTPEEKLRNFIRLLLHRLLGKNGLGRNISSVQITARELTNPSPVMDKIYEKYLKQMIEIMSEIVREMMGGIDNTLIIRFTSSVAGQCLHPLLAGYILERTGFILENNDEAIEKHARHIYEFSLNGIKGYKGEM